MKTNKEIAKELAKVLRKNQKDNPTSWKDILRKTREFCPELLQKRTKKKLPVYLSLEEIDSFLNTAYTVQQKSAKDSVKKGLIVETLVKSGLRNAELCKLRVEDIRWNENIITVIEGKGGKDRVVPLSLSLKGKLRIYLDGRNTGYLFLSNRGNCYTTRSLQLIIEKVRNFAGIQKQITPHTLRHSLASLLINNNVDIRKIQKILGHENLSTTQIYTHLEIKAVIDAAEEVTKLIE